MSFSLDTTDFPRIATLDQAAAHWTKKKPWRFEPSSYRPLEKASKKHCKLIRISENEYRARLHDTDVITYTPEGITVRAGYSSISTDNFIQALLGWSPVMVLGNRGPVCAWQINRGANGYWTKGQLVQGGIAIFDKAFNLTNPRPYKRLTLDRVQSKEVRVKYGINDFMAWRKAYESMCPERPKHPDWRSWRGPGWRPDHLSTNDVQELLTQRGDGWIELEFECTDQHILDCIYRKHPEIVRTEERDTFENLAEYDNWLKLDRKYGWAIR